MVKKKKRSQTYITDTRVLCVQVGMCVCVWPSNKFCDWDLFGTFSYLPRSLKCLRESDNLDIYVLLVTRNVKGLGKCC